ncbi:MAG: glycosyltransferase family 4 protein [Burkholderiales bacterium]|nr:glycosyltransferase family 4 protein [Burkholderiales bacterium]
MQLAANPRRIALVSDDFMPPMTGAGYYLESLASHLAVRGHHVVVLTSRPKGHHDRALPPNLRIHRGLTVTMFGFDQALFSPGQIRRILHDERVELVHHHYLSGLSASCSRVAARIGLPQLYTYHMSVELLSQPLPMRPFRPLLFALYRAFAQRMKAIITPSRKVIPQMQSDGISTPILYLSNPVLFDIPESTAPKPSSDACFRILYVGRLAREKNLALLIRGFAALAARRPRVELWLAGKGLLQPQLEALCAELGIRQKVQFFGHLAWQDLSQRYAQCDVFVLPSKNEVQPMVLLEAMSFGKPIVVSDHVFNPDFLDRDRTCLVVGADDTPAMTDALCTLMDDPHRKEEMGRAALQAVQELKPPVIFARLEKLYDDVLAGREPRI